MHVKKLFSKILALSLFFGITSLHAMQPDPNGSRDIFEAIQLDNLQSVEHWLDEGVDIESTHNYEGWTPLIAALKKQYFRPASHPVKLEVIKLLLNKNATINVTDESGDTPLMLAVQISNLHLVQLILDQKPNINATNKYGETALNIAAASNKNIEIASLLLESGAEINRPNDLGYTPLMTAILHKMVPMVNLLLDKRAHINAMDKYGNTPLILATQGKSPAIVQLLLQYQDMRRDPGGSRDIFEAIQLDKLKSVKHWLDYGVDIESTDKYEGWTPLIAALKKQLSRPQYHPVSLEVIKFLLNNNANINTTDKNGDTPLMLAIEIGNESLVQLILDRKPAINATKKIWRNSTNSRNSRKK